jgi:murein DD-endopeptidase MepM/ murein hydrolase activator NlpD
VEKEKPPIKICSPLTGEPIEELWLITSDPYRPPPPGDDGRHEGVDYAYYQRGERVSIQGAGVEAVLPGWVSTALSGTFPYGNFVIIETPLHYLPETLVQSLDLGPGQALYTVYAHLETPPWVWAGEWVEACAPLGLVGKSGNAGQAHLHLETRTGPAGVLFFDMGYYKIEATEAERANYLRWRIGGEFQHFNPLLVLDGQE